MGARYQNMWIPRFTRTVMGSQSFISGVIVCSGPPAQWTYFDEYRILVQLAATPSNVSCVILG
jgi:hypothetical protein